MEEKRIEAGEENKYRLLFDENPISLWEEDFSAVKQFMDSKKTEINDLEVYIDENPNFVTDCLSKIKILKVNNTSLDLFKVKSKEELINHLGKTFNKKSFETFKILLLAIAKNKKKFSAETEYIKTTGEAFAAIIKFTVINNYKSIFISITDISEQKKTELKLKKQNAEYEALTEEYKTINEELKLAKKSMAKSEENYRNWFDYFPHSTYIWQKKGDDFEMVKSNKRAIDESKGNIKNFFGIKSRIFWKDEPELTAYLEECYNTQKTKNIQKKYRFRSTNKEQFVSVTYSFIPPDSVQIITIDITKQKLADDELKNQKKLFETMFNTIIDGVVITNTKREIVLANNGMKTTFGYDTSELLGKSTQMLYDDNDRFNNSGNSVFNEKSKNKEDLYLTYYKDKDNCVFPGETFGCKLFDTKGKWIGNLGIMRNVSERQKMISDLIISKEKAEESDRLKTEFINNMSHEIRTPMNGILGFTSMLGKPNKSEEKRKQYIKIIQSSGKQLMRVINDILEISKLGTKQVKTVKTEICLNNLLLEQFSIFDIKAKEKKIPLYLKKTLSDERSVILSDEVKLNKIISNLLENALKFTNVGYVELGYTLVQKNESQADLQIYVKDTGIGIKAESQDLIFDRFSQEEKEITKNVGGLGLGLSIAKENAELINGRISLESEKGKGSTFFITIPYNKLNSHRKEEGKLIEKNQNTKSENVILIVEDEEVNHLFLETLLEDFELNLKTLHAKNGKEAIKMCNENSEINLVLMDLKMPIMNGFEATKQIKRLRPKLPIVAQTAYTISEDKESAFLAGCNDFISKPIKEKHLIEIINKYLKLNVK